MFRGHPSRCEIAVRDSKNKRALRALTMQEFTRDLPAQCARFVALFRSQPARIAAFCLLEFRAFVIKSRSGHDIPGVMNQNIVSRFPNDRLLP